MAALFSEDKELASSLKIEACGAPGVQPAAPDESWQRVSLALRSGKRSLDELCLVCRQPEDELRKLVELAGDLAERRRETILFEPAEPSFELVLERTREGGIKVEAWIDAGNADTGFYRWDAAGIRFFTTEAELRLFIEALGKEFLTSA